MNRKKGKGSDAVGLVLLIILVILLVGAFPSWSYSREWGNGPAGLIGVLLIVVIILLVLGVVPHRF